MDTSELTPHGRQALQFIEFDSDEVVACEIRKHPFGVLLILLGGAVVILAILAGTMLALRVLSGDFLETGKDMGTARAVIGLIGGIVALVAVLLMIVIVYLYRKNRILITNHKIAEILYPSIFSRSITQFSLDDIQDVSVKQSGIFPRILDYGTLIIETAGETENLTFTFTPLPFRCAKEIEGVRERHKAAAQPTL